MASDLRIISSPLTALGMDEGWSTVKAGLESVTYDTAGEVADFVSQIYITDTFKGRSIDFSVYAGIPMAQAWLDTHGEIPVAPINKMYDGSATHAWYANAYSIDLASRTWDMYSQFEPLAVELGMTYQHARQYTGALIFNDGFATTAGPDGAYLFSDVHPLATGHTLVGVAGIDSDATANAAGYQSNLMTGALSVTKIAEGINKLADQRDAMDRPLNLLDRGGTVNLFVHSTKVMQTRSYLNIGQSSEYGTGNRNRNPFTDFTVNVIGYPWFSTATKYVFQVPGKHGLRWSEPTTMKTALFEQPDHSQKHEVFGQFTQWSKFWHGVVGSLGT